MSDPIESGVLEEATREYVDRVKNAYPSITEQDVYIRVYEIARQRVEKARR